ncbi:hypothetical protein [Streptomyces sp. BH105]|uniref:hypothetical protein n=1 Tax=Streptomyces sp. BH105 TaxID=3410408 RepID=UPI003CF31860
MNQESHVLPYALAEELPLTDQSTRPMLEVVSEYLAGREALLVLDTCEHLVEDCQEVVATLLRELSPAELNRRLTTATRFSLGSDTCHPLCFARPSGRPGKLADGPSWSRVYAHCKSQKGVHPAFERERVVRANPMSAGFGWSGFDLARTKDRL